MVKRKTAERATWVQETLLPKSLLRAKVDQVRGHGVEDGVLQTVMVQRVHAGYRNGTRTLGVAQAMERL